ncbi:MAG: RT0821/Lpp0805 family surface protein, partial [Pseudomonadota bacterium]
VDRSIVTSSTSASPAAPAASDTDSDQTTIGNAVSSADIKELGGQAVPWANSGTGSRGAITELVELKDAGRTCRSFTATRESFDGVALYKGQLCMAGAGGWHMQAFTAL